MWAREDDHFWLMAASDDGTPDPIAYSSNAIFLSPDLPGNPWGNQWHPVGRTSEVLFGWLAHYYHLADWVPMSFNSVDANPYRKPLCPAMPYKNGLWLRTPDEPFEPAVLDYLTERLGEPERRLRAGNVTTYVFRPEGGIIRVTADEPNLVGGLSAWWVHAQTPEQLNELARLILPFGTLRETLRGDTEPGRAVLASLKS